MIPVNRWPVTTLATTKRWPDQVVTFVEWCGHQHGSRAPLSLEIVSGMTMLRASA